MSETHDDGRPDAGEPRPVDGAPDPQGASSYAPAYAPASAYPAGSFPVAPQPGEPHPAGPYPPMHPGAVPPPGYGMVLVPHAMRPLPAHIDPGWRLAGVGRRAAGRILDQVVFGIVGGLSAGAFIVPLQGIARQRIDDLQLPARRPRT